MKDEVGTLNDVTVEERRSALPITSDFLLSTVAVLSALSDPNVTDDCDIRAVNRRCRRIVVPSRLELTAKLHTASRSGGKRNICKGQVFVNASCEFQRRHLRIQRAHAGSSFFRGTHTELREFSSRRVLCGNTVLYCVQSHHPHGSNALDSMLVHLVLTHIFHLIPMSLANNRISVVPHARDTSGHQLRHVFRGRWERRLHVGMPASRARH